MFGAVRIDEILKIQMTDIQLNVMASNDTPSTPAKPPRAYVKWTDSNVSLLLYAVRKFHAHTSEFGNKMEGFDKVATYLVSLPEFAGTTLSGTAVKSQYRSVVSAAVK